MNIAQVVKQVAVSIEQQTVVLELICSDEYGANVLFDDVLSRLNSDGGLSLLLRTGGMIVDSGASS